MATRDFVIEFLTLWNQANPDKFKTIQMFDSYFESAGWQPHIIAKDGRIRKLYQLEAVINFTEI